eukprot:3166143-Rhodomonas_salina.1
MSMDPQQRLALEVAYEAMHQAFVVMLGQWHGTATGIFVAECGSDFATHRKETAAGPYTATGIASSITANRVSHAFGLRGPSMTIDTA